jgi:hypothetical protein
MMKNTINVLLILSFLSIVSCKTYYEVDSKFYNSKDPALKAIERLVRSQGENFTPNSIELTDEYLAYSKEYREGGGWGMYGGGAASVTRSNSLYFDMIDGVLLLKNKGHYEVRVHNKSSGKWKTFFCWDVDIAGKGADGFAYMSKYKQATD